MTRMVTLCCRDVCGEFDVIWDSKSLVAINLVDHQK